MQDYGIFGDELFVEEERVDGTELRALLGHHGRLDQGVALTIAAQLASVLDYVHGVGDADGAPLQFVHRNLVPTYVRISAHGEVKLAGFGLARFQGRLASTIHGQNRDHVGSISPEEVRDHPVDPRTDLFGLGALMYEMVTGSPPFEADTLPAVWERIGVGAYVAPRERVPDLHDRVCRLIRSLLERDPADRPEGAHRVWEDLWATRKLAGSAHDDQRLRDLVADVLMARRA